MQKNLAKKITNSEYEKLISNSLQQKESKEKSIVNGKIIAIENDMAIVDVGLKSEGRIPLSEFTRPGQKAEIKLGEMLKVFIENVDGANGETKLSREKAIKQSAWNYLQDCYNKNEVVTGIPFNRVKGGMSVDLDGVIAFLPGSQIDSRKIIKDTKELLNKPLDLMILKMDKFRGNIVVSRKAFSDVELKEQRQALLSSISEGSVISGKIKNITDYGVFVDLGGIDGLLHVTDISWKKISHPSDVLELGAQIDVKILKFDEELTRLSLGIKQLSDDPWLKVNDLYSVDQKIKSPVSSISDQGVSIAIDGLANNEITKIIKTFFICCLSLYFLCKRSYRGRPTAWRTHGYIPVEDLFARPDMCIRPIRDMFQNAPYMFGAMRHPHNIWVNCKTHDTR